MQQKGIGEVLGKSLYVRANVGINSRLIKAIPALTLTLTLTLPLPRTSPRIVCPTART